MRWKAFPDCYQSSAPIRLDRSAETSCRSGLCRGLFSWIALLMVLRMIVNQEDFDEDDYDNGDHDDKEEKDLAYLGGCSAGLHC